MAFFWTVLASFLIANCVVNAKNIGEQALFKRVNADEDGNIAKYRVEQDHTLQRRGYHSIVCEGCQTGSYDTTKCWPSLCNSRTITVRFPRPFEKTPSVSVSLAGLDIDKDFNLRVLTSADQITTTGFVLSYHSWVDTKIYQVKLSWVACA